MCFYFLTLNVSDTLAFYATYMLHCSAIIWWDWVGQLAKLVTHLYHKLRCGQVLDCFEWWPLCFQFHEEDALLHSLITIPGKHITFNPCTSSMILYYCGKQKQIFLFFFRKSSSLLLIWQEFMILTGRSFIDILLMKLVP